MPPSAPTSALVGPVRAAAGPLSSAPAVGPIPAAPAPTNPSLTVGSAHDDTGGGKRVYIGNLAPYDHSAPVSFRS
jgi:hypothetical protein